MVRQFFAALAVAALAMGFGGRAPAADLVPFAPAPEAPALVLAALDGSHHDLAAYRGRAVIVNFWATWCAPCIREFPAMDRAQKALADKGVVFLAVNIGQRPDIVAPFVRRLGTRLPILMDADRAAAARWLVKALPTSYVVSPAGRVALGVVGDHPWDGAATLDRLAALARTVAPGR